ncbi:polysaccharide deacetylase family protein [Thermoactinomyces sp. DSM 45892]|uniref:polysaccharide deacetylase family protein n=1 Tax=Thermoactinomyces sp. DSM 45892 TaxID=1882753 RepID=UPI00089B693D|nr:polysaccharide deacetylase family protein [Thermoactinomyces sp. DSM 45892]SDZ34261.1 chitin deacetylase [Thermoactinomyces sp. DSM 45892]
MKKWMIRVALTLAILVIVAYGLFQLSKSRTYQLFGELTDRVNTNEKVVALTLDDGPTEKTDEVLKILKEADVKATFFVTGAELQQRPEEGKKMVQAGHELGNHSYSHTRMVLKSPSFIKNEIEKTDQLIRDAGYKGEILFRPPNGKKLLLLPYYLSQHNRKTIMWDIEPDSYADIGSNSDKIVQHVKENVKPGSIIILHVMYKSREESLKSIKGIVESLREQGYTFKTVSELLAEKK